MYVYGPGITGIGVPFTGESTVDDFKQELQKPQYHTAFAASSWYVFPADPVTRAKVDESAPLDVAALITDALPTIPRRVWVEPAVASSSAVPGTSRQVRMKCLGVVGTRVMGVESGSMGMTHVSG